MKVRTRKHANHFWLDKALVDEGYRPEDIIDIHDPVLELPEIFDLEKRRQVGWMTCPDCGEVSPVNRREPSCPCCGWEQGEDHAMRFVKCAA